MKYIRILKYVVILTFIMISSSFANTTDQVGIVEEPGSLFMLTIISVEEFTEELANSIFIKVDSFLEESMRTDRFDYDVYNDLLVSNFGNYSVILFGSTHTLDSFMNELSMAGVIIASSQTSTSVCCSCNGDPANVNRCCPTKRCFRIITTVTASSQQQIHQLLEQ